MKLETGTRRSSCLVDGRDQQVIHLRYFDSPGLCVRLHCKIGPKVELQVGQKLSESGLRSTFNFQPPASETVFSLQLSTSDYTHFPWDQATSLLFLGSSYFSLSLGQSYFSCSSSLSFFATCSYIKLRHSTRPLPKRYS